MSRINRLTTERNDLELECMHKDARIAALTAEVERLKAESDRRLKLLRIYERIRVAATGTTARLPFGAIRQHLQSVLDETNSEFLAINAKDQPNAN